MQARIRRKIEEARMRAVAKKKPYTIEPTGKGRIKCHAEEPSRSCARCRRRLLMRRIRAAARAAQEQQQLQLASVDIEKAA